LELGVCWTRRVEARHLVSLTWNRAHLRVAKQGFVMSWQFLRRKPFLQVLAEPKTPWQIHEGFADIHQPKCKTPGLSGDFHNPQIQQQCR
jgi:hypothetical protein